MGRPAWSKDMMMTLTQRIESAAHTTAGTVTFIDGDDEETVSWAQLHGEAQAFAAVLQAEGVRAGDHVALLGPTTRNLVTAIQATWLAGAAVVCLPLPMRLGSVEEFIDQTRRRVARADARVLLMDEQLSEFVEPQPGDPPRLELSELAARAVEVGPQGWQRPADDDSALAIIQFTSGSTSEPKGVMLAHHTIGSNIEGMVEVGDLDVEEDVFVSWLPLYHDMGLVGMLTVPMTTGSRLVLGAPQDFTSRPSRWMQWISRHGGTITAGPNFAWALAARALRRAEETLDLSHLRVALNGAEPVDPESVRQLVEAGRRHGLNPGAVFPAFGMAELAIAGAFPTLGAGLRTDVVDRRVLESEQYAAPSEPGADGSREFVILGRPIPGLEMRVVDPGDGHALRPREVGELEIRGTSVTPGYYRAPEATAETFHDGWLRTGDLAYMLEGELVLCGRIKDVIIVGGRNIFPEDVERSVATVEGVRAGNVIAFGVEGRRGQESLVVVAEQRQGAPADLERAVREAARSGCGLPPGDVLLVPPGTLPKTSSGKLQRSLCRRSYVEGSLELVSAG